jgi:hypothetical protein
MLNMKGKGSLDNGYLNNFDNEKSVNYEFNHLDCLEDEEKHVSLSYSVLTVRGIFK